ncbi:reverse transcriptase domain-containing protein [Tanacetum coccineum]
MPAVNDSQRWPTTVNGATWHTTLTATSACGSHVSPRGSATSADWVPHAYVAATSAADVLTEATIHHILERTREITQKTLEDWFAAYRRGEGVAENIVGQPNVRVGPKVEDVVHVMAHPEQRMRL